LIPLILVVFLILLDRHSKRVMAVMTCRDLVLVFLWNRYTPSRSWLGFSSGREVDLAMSGI
jgi:hypothetical protein